MIINTKTGKTEPCDLLPEVHGEAHVPDVTLAVVEASQDGHVGLVGFDVVDVVLHLPWFPAHDGVFTGLERDNEEDEDKGRDRLQLL